MPRKTSRQLTERELEIMQVLWNQPQATVQQVRDALAETGIDRAYTTVATLVNVLVEKGYVHAETESRPHRFRPARTRNEVSRGMLQDLVQRVFRGSRTELLVRLLEAERLSKEELAELEQVLKEARKQ